MSITVIKIFVIKNHFKYLTIVIINSPDNDNEYIIHTKWYLCLKVSLILKIHYVKQKNKEIWNNNINVMDRVN